MKKVYFGCSIAGGRNFAHLYQDIVDIIHGADGHVLSDIFADLTLTAEIGTMKAHATVSEVWERDLEWLNHADALIAEVTGPSLGVGYEIAKFEQLDRPILALFYTPSGLRLSPMISGSPKVQVYEYKDIQELKPVISEFIKSI